MEINTKVKKWDLSKFKSFLKAKEVISKVKRQLSGWEKIIANETTDKRINFKNIQATHNSIPEKKEKQHNQKLGKGPKQTFLQRRHTGV